MPANDVPLPDEQTAVTAVGRPTPQRPSGDEPEATLPRGTTLGRYVVLHHLGTGGVGMVFAAYDPELDRKVAIKLLRDDRLPAGDEEGARARLLREAQALARLSHPNVLTVFDVGTYKDQVFIATELVEGSSLRQWLHGKPRPWKEVLKVFTEAGRGLAAAHATGLIHRDVKPDNVLLGADGRIRVMDFGLARAAVTAGAEADVGAATGEIPASAAADSSEIPTMPGLLASGITQTGSLMGTPAYMAPEQFRGTVDARSDQFAFCVSLYEALYGERPFAAESPHLQLRKASKGEINDPPPGKRLPPWMRQILLRGLSRRPEDRYPSLEALLEALAAGPRRARRRWLAAAAVVLMVAAALLVRELLAPSPWLRPGETTRVAVLPFTNATGDPALDWVGPGLTGMVARTLDDTARIDVVPPARVSAALADLDLGPASGERSPATAWPAAALERIRNALGSHLVVTTRVSREHELYRLDYAILGGGSQRLRTVQGADLMAGASQLAARISRLINPAAPPRSLEEQFSDDPFVNRAYAIGLQQLQVGGPAVAEHYFEVCLDQDPSFDRARLALAEASMTAGDAERAEALLGAVLEAAEEQDDRGLVAEALYLQGLKAQRSGELERSESLVGRALELHRELAASDLAISDLILLGRIAQDQGQWSQSETLYQQALALARRLGAASAEARIVHQLGLLAWAGGELERAERLSREALESFRAQGHRAGIAVALGDLALAVMDQGRLAEARELLAQERELHLRMGNRIEAGITLANLTEAARLADDFAGCVEAGRGAVEETEELESPILKVHVYAGLGYCLLRTGDPEASEAALRRARELAAQVENPLSTGVAALATADFHLYHGRAREAEPFLTTAAAWLGKMPGWDLASDFHRVRARREYLRGRFTAAVEDMRRAREIAGPLWQPYDEEVLAVYEESARRGRRLPVPPPPGPTPAEGQ